MDWKLYLTEFEKKFTKRKIVCHLFQYRVVWEFTGLQETVNSAEFVAFMELATHAKINTQFQQDIFYKISKLREAFSGSCQIVTSYLTKWVAPEDEKKAAFFNWLRSYYAEIVRFISDPLITYIFYNLIHKNRVINNKEVDPEDLFLYQYRDFQVSLMRYEREILRKLKTQSTADAEFFNEFTVLVNDAKQELAILKRTIFKGIGEQ
jgi:hypothetical protein